MPTIALSSKEVSCVAERGFRLRDLIKRIGNLEYSCPESAFHGLAHSIISRTWLLMRSASPSSMS